MKIITDCKLNFEECFNEFNSKVAFKQYGFGGEYLHRGYYCPSIIADIIAGNVSRGKILKQKNIVKPPTFTFGFDYENKLILIQQHDLCEFIFRNKKTEIGIAVSNDMKIQSVTECQFCGEQICSYIFCLYNPYEECIVELTEERYAYFKHQVQVDWSRASTSKNAWVKQHENYIFSVENGYLASYRVQELDTNGLERNVWNDRLFKVQLKRKV